MSHMFTIKKHANNLWQVQWKKNVNHRFILSKILKLSVLPAHAKWRHFCDLYSEKARSTLDFHYWCYIKTEILTTLEMSSYK